MPQEGPGTPAPPPLDPAPVLREARGRFVAGFPGQADRIERLIGQSDARAREELRVTVHRIAGFAGTVGFPTVSARAAELEALVGPTGDPALDVALARDMAGGLREAFARDLAAPPAWLREAAPDAGRRLTVLVIEDDADLADILIGHLQTAGHRAVHVASGEQAIDAARRARPDVTLLDIELPGLDGFSICRLMKADPVLASVPVVFVTTRARLDDRMTALTLGADEFLTKPIDMRELVLRIRLLAGRVTAREAAAGGPSEEGDALDYATFLERSQSALRSTAGALVLLRVPHGRAGAAAPILRDEVRRRDLLGLYDTEHLVAWLPDTTGDAAVDRAHAFVACLAARDVAPAHAGAAASPAPGAVTIESLLLEADEALGEARAQGVPVCRRTGRPPGERAAPPGRPRRVLIAEDDPDVVRIVDTQLRAAGFDTRIAFDGREALALARTAAPDVLVLDLMMPKMSGFDVLGAARSLPSRPKVVVLSARGREEDVARALDLGADDYVVKPFSPQDLRTRIGRLLR